jgi:predicted secreted Zn-dependent protease
MIRDSTLLGATALMLAGLVPAAADTQHSVAYTSYAVNGRTPAEIYRSILSRGPTVAGQKAIAATEARGVQKYTMAQDSRSCRITGHQLTFRFTVQLPRPASLSAMRPKDRQLWQQFSVFLKAHELQHTKLWLGCAAELDRSVMAIRASNCKDTARKADSLWRTMKASCDKLQGSFDRQQRGELLAQPFMQQVMRGD